MIGKFRNDERGNFAIIMALITTSLLVFIGAAVDVGRWLNARSITMSGLDAAVLAAGRTLQLDPGDKVGAVAVAQRFYNANVATRLQLVNDTVTFEINDAATQVVAKGNAYIKTPLLGFASVRQLPLFTGSVGELAAADIAAGGAGGGNLEVALMLDVTGSMCDDGAGPCTSGNKITALKSAAKDLVNIVVSADQSKYISRAALVPFSTRLRVGPDAGGGAMMKTLTNLPATWTGWYNECIAGTGTGASETSGNWQCTQYQKKHYSNLPIMPCVTDRYYESTDTLDTTDDAPGAGKWLLAHGGTRMTLSLDSSDTAPTQHTGTQADPADPSDFWNYISAGFCYDIDNADEVLPLTSDKTVLSSRIDGLSAFGSTSGALGTAWSWYMLSPKWSGVWTTGVSASGNTPGSYSDLTARQANGAPKLRKVAVLMTDGGYNTMRGWKDWDQQSVSNGAKTICENMKAAGIEIYTVGFALDQLSSAERTIATDTLQSCGTDVQHFYQTLNAQQLQQAFRDIALKLSSLHLSK